MLIIVRYTEKIWYPSC